MKSRLCVALLTVFLQVVVTLSGATAVQAADNSSAWSAEQLSGLWEQVDDDTKRPQSWVRITKLADGQFEGVVEKIIPVPGDVPNPKCEKCTDARKNQPVLGMRIISGLRRSDVNRFDGGQILDPDSGDIYRLKMIVLDQGKRLEVRGFIGVSLFGRSQYWRRIEAAAAAAISAPPSQPPTTK